MIRQEPFIGGIVHFVYGDQHYAAIITRVNHNPDTVNITVFPPDDEPFATFAEFDDTNFDPATWHWREDAS